MTKMIKTNNEWYLDCDGKLSDPLKLTSDGKAYELPTNSANRKWVFLSKLANKTELELSYRATRVLGPRGGGTQSKKSWTEYLSDEDKILYEELKARGEKIKKEAEEKKPLSALEKAKIKYERELEKYQKLLDESKKN